MREEETSSGPMTLTQARALRDQLGAEGLRDFVLARLEKLDDNSIIAWRDTGTGLPQGPLHGMPFAVKDNIDCLPFPTTGGAPALKSSVPSADASVVATLKAQGAYVPAKTNLHELAFGVTSNNAAFGPVRNPIDEMRVAGGSSGGNAAAVARGVVPFAIGSDTGGSTRIPSAFCGIAGFRPSAGRYASDGVLLISPTRDTIGPMAANCSDLAEIDALLVPHDPDPYPIESLRIGVMNASTGYSHALDSAIARALAALQNHDSFEIVHLHVPEFENLDARFGNTIVFHEAHQIWTDFCNEHLGISLREFTTRIASPDVRALFEELPKLAAQVAPDYQKAIEEDLPALRRTYAKVLDDNSLDLIAMPTVSVQPPLIGEDAEMQTDNGMQPTFPTITAHTSLAPLTGAPSLALPAGRDSDGLPVSLMFEGPIGADRFVLFAGCVIEQILPKP